MPTPSGRPFAPSGRVAPSPAPGPETDVLELLARDDKWYLGTGEATIFAPQFPQWLDAPGFWDGALLYHYELAPLFTVAALDQRGRELALRSTRRRWTPAELTVDYQVGDIATA